MNIGIVLPNWISDCVMATPTLRAIRKQFAAPHRLIGVMRPYVADVLVGTDWLDETILCQRQSEKPAHRFNSVVDQLQHRNLDAMVLLTNSLSSAWLAWRSGARQRIGYARDGRSLMLTQRIAAPKKGRSWQPTSAVDYYLELAYALECGLEPRRLELATTDEDELVADQLWRKFQLDRAAGVVVLNTSGGAGAAKSWPAEHFSALALRITRELNHSVLVICGPDEQDAAAQIEAQANDPRVVSLAGEQQSIGLSKACVRRADVMVTTDSGPRHFAAAFDVPVVSLFGPTDPRRSINYHADETRLFEPVACGQNEKRACPPGQHHCLTKLQVERVFAEVAKKINCQPLRRAA